MVATLPSCSRTKVMPVFDGGGRKGQRRRLAGKKSGADERRFAGDCFLLVAYRHFRHAPPVQKRISITADGRSKKAAIVR